jgi:uncharacterized protein Smg (DUF494 family)
MISDIVNVLAELVERMKKSAINGDFETLLQKKYDKKIVAAAYSWIYEKNTRPGKSDDFSHKVRILSEDEIDFISLENYNHLLHFFNIGLINSYEFNSIIEKILLLPDDHVNIDNINILILALYLDTDDIALPGSRILLNSSDTIN